MKLFLKKLDPNFTCYFNLANPNGVKLLGNKVANNLQRRLINPSISDSDETDRLLQEHELLDFSNDSKKTLDASFSGGRLSLWIHLVDCCNLSCSYCYVRSVVETDFNRISALSFSRGKIQLVLSSIFQYCRNNNIKSLGLKFSGGEPTLNLNLLDVFCKTANELREEILLNFSIITNGTNCSKQFIDLLRKYGFKISISMDGMATQHDSVRFFSNNTDRGTWSTISRTIRECKKHGISPYVLFTLTPNNVADLIPFSQFCQIENIGYRISLMRKDAAPSKEDLDLLSDSLVGLYEHLGKNQPTDMPIERYAKFGEWNLKKRKMHPCSSGREYFAVDAQGNLSTCQMAFSKSYGDISLDSMDVVIKRLHEDRAIDRLTKNIEINEICALCEYKFVCAGGCPQNTMQVYKTFESPSPYCFVYRNLLPSYIDAIGQQMLRRYKEVSVPIS